VEQGMRLALGHIRKLSDPKQLSDEMLQFIKQLGVDEIHLSCPILSSETQYEFMDLLHLRMRCEDAGLRLGAIEEVPITFYDKAMLGLPGRDEQIEHMATTIRNIGRAGIPILGYHWMPNFVWRTSRTTRGRGGAKVTSFDMELAKHAPLSHGRVYTADEMWANYEYFVRAIVPVAEEAEVKLALHPDDPPVESLGGVARIFRDFEGFKRAMELVDSPVHGMLFCQGCWSEMGTGVIEAIRYFGGRGKLFYVHFRDVQGTVPRFQECFINEGNSDMFEVIKALKEAGFSGPLLPDHVPEMAGDTPWGHRGRAHAIGYMAALLERV
jgi:mannonate dehydratase